VQKLVPDGKTSNHSDESRSLTDTLEKPDVISLYGELDVLDCDELHPHVKGIIGDDLIEHAIYVTHLDKIVK
jgi:hypothetical protein